MISLRQLFANMKRVYPILIGLLVTACIGTDIVDDFVEARVAITNPIASLAKDSMYQFEATYLNNVGMEEDAEYQWESSDREVLEIDSDGLAFGLMKGIATVTVTANGVLDTLFLTVSDTTIGAITERTAELQTVSSYPLEGDVTLKEENGKTVLIFEDNFNTTSALPGLYVYLTNNVNTINNALEVGRVENFTGAQRYEITEQISLTDYNFVLFYCKPFLVPVGNGELMP